MKTPFDRGSNHRHGHHCFGSLLKSKWSFFLLALSVNFLVIEPIHAQQLQPFTTDGCSAFPNGTFLQNSLWLECCTAHDVAYWKGGSFSARKKADEALRECVAAVGEPFVAGLMLMGVRVGGSPFLPTTFRWGYGWPYPRAYQSLTAEEQLQVGQQCVAASVDC